MKIGMTLGNRVLLAALSTLRMRGGQIGKAGQLDDKAGGGIPDAGRLEAAAEQRWSYTEAVFGRRAGTGGSATGWPINPMHKLAREQQ